MAAVPALAHGPDVNRYAETQRGIVRAVSRTGTFIAVEDQRGGYTVLETQEDWPAELGQEVSGPLHDLGCCKVLLVRTGERIRVIVQWCGCDEAAMREALQQ